MISCVGCRTKMTVFVFFFSFSRGRAVYSNKESQTPWLRVLSTVFHRSLPPAVFHTIQRSHPLPSYALFSSVVSSHAQFSGWNYAGLWGLQGNELFKHSRSVHVYGYETWVLSRGETKQVLEMKHLRKTKCVTYKRDNGGGGIQWGVYPTPKFDVFTRQSHS